MSTYNSQAFTWLKQHATSEEDEKIISKIKEWNDKARGKGEYPKSDELLSVNLGKHKIWSRKCNAHASVSTYYEIFKEKSHFLVDEFNGKNAETVLDIGAHEGFYTLKIKENNPECEVIAVEPVPFSFQILKKNVRSNIDKNVTLKNKAISNKIGKIEFNAIKEFPAVSNQNLKPEISLACPWLEDDSFEKIKVNCTTLNELYRNHDIEDIDILKIDTEGMEIKILRGGKDILSKVRKIVVEWHTKKARKQVKSILEKNNFELVFEERGNNNGHEYGDFYFINEEK